MLSLLALCWHRSRAARHFGSPVPQCFLSNSVVCGWYSFVCKHNHSYVGGSTIFFPSAHYWAPFFKSTLAFFWPTHHWAPFFWSTLAFFLSQPTTGPPFLSLHWLFWSTHHRAPFFSLHCRFCMPIHHWAPLFSLRCHFCMPIHHRGPFF